MRQLDLACHQFCNCAVNIFETACSSFTFQYSQHHRPSEVQHSTHLLPTQHETQTHTYTPSPTSSTLPFTKPPTHPPMIFFWVLTCIDPLIKVTANTLLNDPLLPLGHCPQCPTDSKGHPSVFQYWLSGPFNVTLGVTESEHLHQLYQAGMAHL